MDLPEQVVLTDGITEWTITREEALALIAYWQQNMDPASYEAQLNALNPNFPD